MRNFEEIISIYALWVLKWRKLVVASSIFVVCFLATGTKFLSFNNDYRAFFGNDDPQLNSFEALQNIYTKNDNILFVIAPENGDVFTPANLDAIETMVRKAWKIPYSIRVDAITNYQHSRADGDHLIVNDLIINALDKNSDFVFSRNKRGEMYKGDFRASMRNALKKAGIEKRLRFHDLRHTFAANYMMSNGSITSLNKILGHSTLQMTMRYIHFSPEYIEGEIDKLSYD